MGHKDSLQTPVGAESGTGATSLPTLMEHSPRQMEERLVRSIGGGRSTGTGGQGLLAN